MNSEKWLDAMGMADEKYLAETEQVREEYFRTMRHAEDGITTQKTKQEAMTTPDGMKISAGKQNRRKSYTWIKWGSMAAALALIVLIGGNAIRLSQPKNDNAMSGGSASNSDMAADVDFGADNEQLPEYSLTEDIAENAGQNEQYEDIAGDTADATGENWYGETNSMQVRKTVYIEITDIVEDGFYGNEIADEEVQEAPLTNVYVQLEENCDVIVGESVFTYREQESDVTAYGLEAGRKVMVSYWQMDSYETQDGKKGYVLYAVKVE